MRRPATRLHCDILIVGAGIAGSAAACALRGRGLRIVQVEMSRRPLDTARGDHLQCSVVELLERWGALDALIAAGAEQRRLARYVTDRGTPILEVDYALLDIPHPFYLYLHHELLAATFLGLAANDPDHLLLRGVRARDFAVGAAGIESLALRLPQDAPAPAGLSPGESLVVVPRLVLAADGRSSRVREALGFSAEEHDYANPLVIHFAPRLPSERDPRNVLTTFLGPHGAVGRIPRAFGGWKIGATIRRADLGFWKTASDAERRGAIAALAPELEPLELELAGFYPVKLLNTHRWVRGNTVLVGDACHAMHPTRGQGMNTALRCLAELVERLPGPEVLASVDSVVDLLAGYESAVKPGIDAALAENHALGSARDSLEPQAGRRLIEDLQRIQRDPQRLRAYTRNAAGYPAAVQRSMVASERSV